jgi:hypothetical protein
MTTELAKIQLRRDTASNWTAANPTLSAGELGMETDTFRFKIGDGVIAWDDLKYESGLATNGSTGSPNAITASGGISVLGLSREYQFVESNGGAVTVTANPQIDAGDWVGQELILQGVSDTNTLSIADGNGLSLNGGCVLKASSRIYLVWDGTAWGEVSRNDI